MEPLAESAAHRGVDQTFAEGNLPIQFEPYPGIGKITRKVLRPSREPLVRLQIVAIWTFIALLYSITRAHVASRGLAIASVAAIAFFLYPFIEGPIRLHARGKLALHAGYQIAPQTSPDSLSFRDGQLQSLGFEYAGQIIDPVASRNVGVRLLMYVHEQNQDSAQVAEVISGLRTIPALVFKSRFQDGFAFETNNMSQSRIFPGDPEFPVFRFPALRSTADLYRIHRKIKEQFLTSRHPVMAGKEGELAEFIARAEIAHQRMAQCGDYELAPEGDRYVLTWKGALRQSWLLAWPVKQIRQLRLYSQSLKQAEELGLPINEKLGQVGQVDPSTGRIRRRT